MAKKQHHTNPEILRAFQSKLKSLLPETQGKYRRTISDLDLFISSHSIPLASFDERSTADFAAALLLDGLSISTVVRHLNILNSLLTHTFKQGLTTETEAPRKLSRRLTDKTFSLPPLLQTPFINKVLPYLRAGLKEDAAPDPARDLFLLALLNGRSSLKELALLNKEAASDFDETSKSIIARNISPRRDYVFDLRQSYLSKGKLYSSIAAALRPTLGRLIPLPEFDPDTLLAAILADLAIRNGASASEAAGFVGGTHAASYLLPDFVIPTEIQEEKKKEYKEAIHGMLLSDQPRWFALHFRHGVDYDTFRFDLTEQIRPVPELFYPVETIRKVSRGRTTFEDQPFISNICFFRIAPEHVLKIMHTMGDKVWVYRMSNSPLSPYAVISDRDMTRFQRAVGQFTPDTEIYPAGTLTPKPGEKVVIIKPGYHGREAKVEEVLKDSQGSTIIRVLLSTEQGYEWRLDLDPRQLERP